MDESLSTGNDVERSCFQQVSALLFTVHNKDDEALYSTIDRPSLVGLALSLVRLPILVHRCPTCRRDRSKRENPLLIVHQPPTRIPNPWQSSVWLTLSCLRGDDLPNAQVDYVTF